MKAPGKIEKNPDTNASILCDIWSFMRVRKKWWLGPIFLFLLLLSILLVFTEGAAVAPFVYTLF